MNMIIFTTLYALFFMFTHKQIYAGRHFTGGKKQIGFLLLLMGNLNTILSIAFLIYTAVKLSVLSAIMLLIIAWIFLYCINVLLSKIVMRKAKKECDSKDPLFFSLFNYLCDVTAVKTALIGIIANILIVVVTLCVL